jgi:general secretion pathway protein J
MCNKTFTKRLLRQTGLTLIELLVAITVLAFVAVLGWRGLDSITRARIALTGDLEKTRGMQLAFAQLQSDCAHLANSTVLSDRIPLAFETGRLILVRTVFADNQPSRLQVVSYSVSGGILARRESAVTRDLSVLDAMWQAAVKDTDTTPAVSLQSDVTALTMRLWINGGWRSDSNTQSPSKTVGSTANPVLPTGLEVKLGLRGGDTSLLKIFLLGAV